MVRVSTPGGGGYGDPAKRDPAAIARDVARGYYSEAEAREKFGQRQAADDPGADVHSLALPLAVAAGELSAQSTWYAVRGPDHAFIVDMPGEPVYKVIDTRSPGGTAFAYHSYSLEYRRLSFVAQTALYPADIDLRQPRAYLQSVLDDRAQRLAGGKWISVDWRDVQGAPAAESSARCRAAACCASSCC